MFFASIDQRDDSAGGESACTALVTALMTSEFLPVSMARI